MHQTCFALLLLAGLAWPAAHCVQHIGGTTGIAPFDQTLAWITTRLP